MKTFFQPVVQAVRGLRKNPGFTLSALAVLTLGIGANTAIFSVVNAVLLKPLPLSESDGLVTVYHVPPAVAFPGLKRFSVSVANYLDWRKQNHVFESMSAFGGRELRLGGGARPRSFLATVSDADFFNVLRARPLFGRTFTDAECTPGRDAVVVLSFGFAVVLTPLRFVKFPSYPITNRAFHFVQPTFEKMIRIRYDNQLYVCLALNF